MAILRSAEGKFYDVPDDDLAGYEVPADQVKGLLGAAGPGPSAGPGRGPSGGAVQPYGPHHFCGSFRNCGFRNCGFRNCCG